MNEWLFVNWIIIKKNLCNLLEKEIVIKHKIRGNTKGL